MAKLRFEVGALTIGAYDPRALAGFYSRLLGWPMGTVEEPKGNEPAHGGFARICPLEGETAPTLNFEYEREFTSPVWPSVAGGPNATQHLDIGVDDLDAAAAWAIECGATLAGHQPQPHVRVMLDPEGHPFCLC